MDGGLHLRASQVAEPVLAIASRHEIVSSVGGEAYIPRVERGRNACLKKRHVHPQRPGAQHELVGCSHDFCGNADKHPCRKLAASSSPLMALRVNLLKKHGRL